LILAHNNPDHVARLAQALATQNNAIFIHIDNKADIRPFLRIRGENIHFTPKRVPVYWGDFSTTAAILLLINAAMAMPERYDYLVHQRQRLSSAHASTARDVLPQKSRKRIH
jgi:hypothetical protein